MVLVLSSSIARGPKAGVITASGVATGLLGHTFLVALGLGALLQASELAFDIMKYVGAAYLFYLGVKLFKASAIGFDNVGDVDGSMSSFFFKGMISKEGANKRGNSSRLTQSFHFFSLSRFFLP